MELDPPKQALFTPASILECIFSDENYMFIESLVTSVGQRTRKTRTADRGASRLINARDIYLCGITNKRILEHALAGGLEAPSDPTSHEGKRFTNLYGVPWPFFVILSDEFHQWCTNNGRRINLKAECPFKLRTMACFRQMRSGGSMTQFREGYNIVGSVFHDFFHLFLDWQWEIKHLHI
jgi:hypothetical protein